MSGIDNNAHNNASGSSDLKTLLRNVNNSSASARLGWIAFIVLSAVLFVILASIKDYQLLLNTPITIPLVNLAVPLKTFFLVMPGIYIFAHFSILLQNVLLAQKVEIFDTNASNLEELNHVAVHPIRFQLNSYFMTQVIAGPTRHKTIGRYLDDISWISLTVLPQLVLIYFLLTFLPYHDIFSTWVHRFYILLDILVILTISTYFTAPLLSFSGALWDTVKYYPLRTLFSSILVGLGLFFSFAIATIPGEIVERRLLPFNVLAPSFIINSKEDSFFLTSLLFGDKNAEIEEQRTGLFKRNLYLTDRNINELQKAQTGESRINLRARDLRYATFNRSNIIAADFSSAQLQGASFIATSLKNGIFHKTIADGTLFVNSNLNGVNFTTAKLFGTNFTESSLINANFTKASIIASNFSNAKLAGANFRDAKLHGSHFYKADLRTASFFNSWLTGVSLSDANLLAADLRKGTLWETVPSSKNTLLDIRDRKIVPPSKQEKAWIRLGVQQIIDKSLRTKIIAILSPIFNRQSANGWPKSLDYNRWRAIISQSRQAQGSNFSNKLSTLLANLSCYETAPKAYLTTSIIERITATDLHKATYNGNAEHYLKIVMAQNCPAFTRVAPHVKQKIFDLVLHGQSIDILRPKRTIKPAITAASPITPALTAPETEEGNTAPKPQ